MRTWAQVEQDISIEEAKAPKLTNMATLITAGLDELISRVINQLPARVVGKGRIRAFVDDALKVEADGEGTSKGDLPLKWYMVAWWTPNSGDGRVTCSFTVPDRGTVELKYDFDLDTDLGKVVGQVVSGLTSV